MVSINYIGRIISYTGNINDFYSMLFIKKLYSFIRFVKYKTTSIAQLQNILSLCSKSNRIRYFVVWYDPRLCNIISFYAKTIPLANAEPSKMLYKRNCLLANEEQIFEMEKFRAIKSLHSSEKKRWLDL